MNSLIDLLDKRASEFPNLEILHFLDDGENISDSLTYLDLQKKSQNLAGLIQASELDNDRVLICLPQNLTYFIGFYACIYAGVIAVPAFPPRSNQNIHRLTKIIGDSGATKVLIDRVSYEYIRKNINGFNNIDYIIYEDADEGIFSYSSIYPIGADIAYLQYTSGSTGSPKGTMISHTNVLTNSEACIETTSHQLRRAVSWLPLYHDMGLISWFTYLVIGEVTCYMMSAATFTQSPIKWLKAVSRYKAEFTLGPNFAYDLCCARIKEEELNDIDLSTLYSVVCGSEKVKFSTIKNFCEKFGKVGFNREAFCPSYGLAEATLIVSVNQRHNELKLAKSTGNSVELTSWEELESNHHRSQDIIISIGDPVRGAEIEIVNEMGQRAEEKEVGEIHVHFPGSVASGYWGNEILTDEIFHNEIVGEKEKKYLKTGDLGFFIENSYFYVGRKKEIIVIRGKKYFPEDIEQTLRISCDKIEANGIAALSVEDQDDEKLIIIAELKRQYARDKSFDSTIKTIRQEIAMEFEIQPQAIVLIRPYSMNKTTSGKIQRTKLKELFLSNQLDIIHSWKSLKDENDAGIILDEIIDREFFAKWLCSKISEYAEFPAGEIDLNLPLKNYPLDSLNAVTISQDIYEMFTIKTRPDVFWAFDSIDELVDYIYNSYLNKKT